ncbi:uncharacterized protein PHACADRAFT_98836 [Phanerochaete carnosa HHB-10118-sp]|uniref:RNA-binding S4 domain-containing protein n=1 Tax=Phanerochaete carnosa (strain HHB-10118-sp) TaxID=650164 RepID=K5W1U4_PHACS|nr:uncharacterized protein PHACADRAFT_98836 [Phanerochaete carnosa HHB-10118-sp]EKM53100.1 hypothetical protein PHACADRAFT_98836 [Phanerochaete carnosa HHB-10118-sp]
MRDVNVFCFKRALPRMSWSPRNLFNLWQRSIGPKQRGTNFFKSTTTLFQNRWQSKALVRAYHGDFINEKIFKRWYLPSTLPDVRPRRSANSTTDAVGLARWARKDRVADKEARLREEEDAKGLAPVGSLMLSEIERRIDVVVFRACLASSVYEARRLVIHGDVLLNGKKHQNANTRLAPGDMVSVDPAAIRFLRPLDGKKTEVNEEEESDEAAEDAEASAAEAEAPEQFEAKTKAKPAAKPGPTGPQYPWNRKDKADLTPFHPPPFSSPWMFIPAYIEPSFATCSAIYLRHPTARPGYSEIPTPYDADGEVIRFAWEWYAKVRPRVRSKSQLARMPENR